LLAALPDADYLRLAPHLEWVALPFGELIAHPDERMTHVIFPTEGIVSVLATLENGISVEIAIIGNEGMVGMPLSLAGVSTLVPPRRSVVQMAGQAYRLSADFLIKEFERGGELRHKLLRYTQMLITQIAQIAVCNRHHALEARMCRWLLQRFDRLASHELYVTQEEIAGLLGERREAVTEAANKLQQAALIRCSRGHVVMLDRVGIEQRVCECLGVLKKEYANLLSA
jgi:CRP-like cAMP-binding protein